MTNKPPSRIRRQDEQPDAGEKDEQILLADPGDEHDDADGDQQPGSGTASPSRTLSWAFFSVCIAASLGFDILSAPPICFGLL